MISCITVSTCSDLSCITTAFSLTESATLWPSSMFEIDGASRVCSPRLAGSGILFSRLLSARWIFVAAPKLTTSRSSALVNSARDSTSSTPTAVNFSTASAKLRASRNSAKLGTATTTCENVCTAFLLLGPLASPVLTRFSPLSSVKGGRVCNACSTVCCLGVCTDCSSVSSLSVCTDNSAVLFLTQGGVCTARSAFSNWPLALNNVCTVFSAVDGFRSLSGLKASVSPCS
mmetsp:Transcript_1481/g.2527  ORF Transcript_1481/g.2527 Transcript_1481/m.2527 type:complete len:231 (-) Transcript_1481:1056-1748(-)